MRAFPAFALLLSAASIPASVSGGPGDAPRVPVVVELFTSEGCSDCPPADALLAQLDRAQPVPEAEIIPLEEHVDYWNQDGWRDPFSSSAFTARQETYARRFGLSGPYTPQMVVAGRTQFVGSAASKARAAIAAAARAAGVPVTLGLTVAPPPGASFTASIRVDPVPPEVREDCEILFAITEDALASNVSAGENSGRRLEHRAVVRRLIAAGRTEAGRPFSANVSASIAPQWKRENLRVVAFLSGRKSGHILGAAASRVVR